VPAVNLPHDTVFLAGYPQARLIEQQGPTTIIFADEKRVLAAIIKRLPLVIFHILGEFKQTTLKSHRISDSISDFPTGLFLFWCR